MSFQDCYDRVREEDGEPCELCGEEMDEAHILHGWASIDRTSLLVCGGCLDRAHEGYCDGLEAARMGE